MSIYAAAIDMRLYVGGHWGTYSSVMNHTPRTPNGRRSDAIFKYIFLFESCCVLFKIHWIFFSIYQDVTID